MRVLRRIGLIVVMPILMVGVLLTPQLARGSRIDPMTEATTRTPAVPDAPDPSEKEDRNESDGPIDLYGNGVTDAVAKYKLDATGSLYETHSPQTELPRLSSPKS